MNLRRGLYSEQPDVNFQRSPIAEEPPVLMATTGPLLFGRSECHQRGLLETKDKRGADRVRKRWEIWTRWGYSFDSLSLRARQNACWLLGGVHSTPLQCQPGVSENHHRPWAHPLPLLVCVCARVCVCVQNKSPFFLFFFFAGKSEFSFPFFLLSRQDLLFLLIPVIKTVKKAFENRVSV